MSKVDFIEISSLGRYIGKGGKIIIHELNLQLNGGRIPVQLVKSNDEKEEILCSYLLTEIIEKIPTVINHLPYFIVIETPLRRKSISSNRVSDSSLNLSDYIVEIIPTSVTWANLNSNEDR